MTAVYSDRIRGVSTGVAIKAPARAATTANIALSGLQTIDGVTLAVGDRVLAKDQTAASENGVWIVASGAWSRATDFNDSQDVIRGTQIFVIEGDVSSGVTYALDTADAVVGSSALVFRLSQYLSTLISTAAAASSSATASANSATAAETSKTEAEAALASAQNIVFENINFPSRAAFVTAVAAGDLNTFADGSVITVLQNANVLQYRKLAGATELTDIPNWMPASPTGEFYPQHYTANVTPGTTDMTTAIEKAMARANSMNVADPASEYPGTGVFTVTGMGERLAVSRPMYYNGYRNIRIQDTTFAAIAGTWPAGDWAAGVAVGDRDLEGRSNFDYAAGMFEIRRDAGAARKSSSVVFENCGFEANHLAAGFVHFDDTVHRCGVLNCLGHGPKEFGISATTKNGDFTVEANRFVQFNWGEPGYDDWNERTACLIDIRTTDARIMDNTPFYCLVPLRIWSSKCTVSGNHPFNGHVDNDTPAKAIPSGLNELCCDFRTKASVISDNYFDNGVIRWDCDSGYGDAANVFADNTFIKIPGTAAEAAVLFITATTGKRLSGWQITGNTFSEHTDDAYPVEFKFEGPWATYKDAVTMGNIRANPDNVLATIDSGFDSYARGLPAYSIPGYMVSYPYGGIGLFANIDGVGGIGSELRWDASISKTVATRMISRDEDDRFATVTGTANALILSTGRFLPSIPEGFSFRFKPTATNTGAATAVIDGLASVPIQTWAGAAVPAAYLLTGEVCDATYTGGALRVRWEPRVTSVPDGVAVREHTGAAKCRQVIFTNAALSTAYVGGFRNTGETWTYPEWFASGSVPNVTGTSGDFTSASVFIRNRNANACTVYHAAPNSAASASLIACLQAEGRWY